MKKGGIFLFSLCFLTYLLFFPRISLGQEFDLETIANYLELPESNTKRILSTLIQELTDKWIEVTSSSDLKTEEQIVLVVLRQAIRADFFNYLVFRVPKEMGKDLIGAIYKIALFLYSPDKMHFLWDEFEKMSVEKAKEYAINWLLQNEVRAAMGNIKISYRSFRGNQENVIFQYILVHRPINYRQAEVGIEIYSSKSIEPPIPEGTVMLGTLWESYEWERQGREKLKPFIVRIKGNIENLGLEVYEWTEGPEIEIEFPEEVSEFDFPDPSFFEKQIKRLEEERLLTEKALDVVRNVFKGARELINKTTKEAGKESKNATEKVVSAVKNVFSRLNPFGAQVATPSLISEIETVGGVNSYLGDKKVLEEKDQEIQELMARIEELEEELDLEEEELPKKEVNLDELTDKIEQISSEMKKIEGRITALMNNQARVGEDVSSTGGPEDFQENQEIKEDLEKEGQKLEKEKQEKTVELSGSLPKILISEVCVGLEKSSNEFIELYNPNSSPIFLSDENFNLKLVSSNDKVTEKKVTWNQNTIIPNGYFLLVGGEIKIENEIIDPDATFSSQLSGTSGVIITDGKDNILDKVAWGNTGKPPPLTATENKGIVLEPALKTNQSIERKSFLEINNNSLDFSLNNNPSPTNSLGQRKVYLPPVSVSPFVGYSGGGGGGEGDGGALLPPPEILITEIQIEGSEDFIEIYNALVETIDLSNWRLRKRTEKGSEYSVRVFPEGTYIFSKDYLLWASSKSNYHQEVSADLFSSAYLSKNNSIALLDGNENIVDAVAWGENHTNPFIEGLSFSQNPKAGQVVGRKWSVSNQSYQDIGNNAQDFEIQFPTPKAKNETFQDLISPETIIDSQPLELTNSTQATFTFSSTEENLSFECKLDEEDWRSCFSPQDYLGLGDGRHLFQLRAKDEAGNVDPTPAQYLWTVDTLAPKTNIVLFPPVLSILGEAHFVFHASEDNCAFQCQLDEGSWTDCNFSRSYYDLTEGHHSFSAKSKDQAGNLELEPTKYSWMIDTTIENPNLLLVDLDSASYLYSNERTVYLGISNNTEAIAWLLSETIIDPEDPGVSWQTERPGQFVLSGDDGLKTVYLWTKDGAGNVSEVVSASIILDTMPPAVQFSGLLETQTSTTFVISWLGQDESGVLEYYLQFREGLENNWQDLVITSEESTEFSGQNGNAYYFRIGAQDAAGNISSWSTEAPTLIEQPILRVFPESLVFEAVEFGGNPASQELNIENAGFGQLVWTAELQEETDWLSLDIFSGDTATVVRVSVDISGLEVNQYLGEIIISGEKIVPVLLDLREDTALPAFPIITSHSQDEILDSTKIHLVGTTEPNALILIGTEQVRADEEGQWTMEIELKEGENEIEILAQDEAGNVSDPSILRLFVEIPLPILEVLVSELDFLTEKGENPLSKLLIVRNIGMANMDWTISGDVKWLLMNPISGVLAADDSVEVEIQADVSGLTAGNYFGTLTITAPLAENRSMQALVNLEVIAKPITKILINEIQIDSVEGTGGASNDWVELYNPSEAPVDLTGWSIQEHSASDPCSIGKGFYKKNFSEESLVLAKGFFLIVDTQADQALKDITDMEIGWSLTENNTVYLVSNGEKINSGDDRDIVDKVGFGEACFPEDGSAPNPPAARSIERVELGQDTDDNSQDFQINENPSPTNSQGETKQGPEPTIGTIATGVSAALNNGRKIVRTSSGDLYVVYSKENSGISNIFLATSVDGGKTWTEQAVTTDSECDQKEPSIGIDSKDNLHLVWQGKIPENEYWQIRYRKYNGSWQGIEDLTFDENWDQKVPVIVVDLEDNIHMAWMGGNVIYRIDDVEDGWDEPEVVKSSESKFEMESGISYFSFTIDSQDGLHFIWQERYPTGWGSMSDAFRYRKRTDGTWQEVEKLGSYGSDCSIAIDSKDNVHVVWERTYGPVDHYGNYSHNINYKKYTRGTNSWSGTENLRKDNKYGIGSPSISVDSNDNIYVVWRGSDGGYNVIHKTKFDGQGWQSIEELFSERGQFLPNLLWGYYPASNRPKTGFAFVYYEGGELKFYGSEDLRF